MDHQDHWVWSYALGMNLSGFPCGSAGKESTCNAGDLGLIPGLGRSPGKGKDHLLQYSLLENSMDYRVHGVAKSWTQLSDFHFHFQIYYVVLGKSCNYSQLYFPHFKCRCRVFVRGTIKCKGISTKIAMSSTVNQTDYYPL